MFTCNFSTRRKRWTVVGGHVGAKVPGTPIAAAVWNAAKRKTVQILDQVGDAK